MSDKARLLVVRYHDAENPFETTERIFDFRMSQGRFAFTKFVSWALREGKVFHATSQAVADSHTK